MSPFDEHTWSMYACHALQGLLAAPIGSIVPERVLGMDDFANMAAQYADEMLKLQRARFSPPAPPSDAQEPEEPPAESAAGSDLVASGEDESEHRFFEQLFEPSIATRPETPPDP